MLKQILIAEPEFPSAGFALNPASLNRATWRG
jgi:hypothetical protein